MDAALAPGADGQLITSYAPPYIAMFKLNDAPSGASFVLVGRLKSDAAYLISLIAAASTSQAALRSFLSIISVTVWM